MSASSAVWGVVTGVKTAAVITGSMATTGETILDSVIGAGLELLIVQQGDIDVELSSLPSSCVCIPAIIGQSGGHCMEPIGPTESGTQNASEAEGANNANSTKLAETTLYQIRILTFYPFDVTGSCDGGHSLVRFMPGCYAPLAYPHRPLFSFI